MIPSHAPWPSPDAYTKAYASAKASATMLSPPEPARLRQRGTCTKAASGPSRRRPHGRAPAGPTVEQGSGIPPRHSNPRPLTEVLRPWQDTAAGMSSIERPMSANSAIRQSGM